MTLLVAWTQLSHEEATSWTSLLNRLIQDLPVSIVVFFVSVLTAISWERERRETAHHSRLEELLESNFENTRLLHESSLRELENQHREITSIITSLKDDLRTYLNISKQLACIEAAPFGPMFKSITEHLALIDQSYVISSELDQCLNDLRKFLLHASSGEVHVSGGNVVPYAIKELATAKRVFATSFLDGANPFWATNDGNAYLEANLSAANKRCRITRVFVICADQILTDDLRTINEHLSGGILTHVLTQDEVASTQFITHPLRDFARYYSDPRRAPALRRASTWRRVGGRFCAVWYYEGSSSFLSVQDHIAELEKVMQTRGITLDSSDKLVAWLESKGIRISDAAR